MRLPEIALVFALLAGGLAAHADPVDLKPFRANYGAQWKGISAASASLELKRAGVDTYVYETVNKPRGLFRLALPDSLVQSSTFTIRDGHVVPLRFQGSDEKERPIDLKFDWEHGHVAGVAKNRDVDLSLEPGTQDPMSLQIACLRNLASGQLDKHIWLLDGDKLKEFELEREGEKRLETALGTFDTIVYSSKRAGSDTLTRTWVAPALGYLPVKAERVRGSKVEFTLLIESVE